MRLGPRGFNIPLTKGSLYRDLHGVLFWDLVVRRFVVEGLRQTETLNHKPLKNLAGYLEAQQN